MIALRYMKTLKSLVFGLLSLSFILMGCDLPAPEAEIPTSAAPTFWFSTESPSNALSVKILGMADPFASIEIFKNSPCAGDADEVAFADGFGEFESDLVSVAENATTQFFLRSTDEQGNASECSQAQDFVNDSALPAAPSLLSTSPNGPSNNNDIYIVGTKEPRTTLLVYSNLASQPGDCQGNPVAFDNILSNSQGAFSVPMHVASNAKYRFSARAVDAAQNQSSCSVETVEYEEDSTPPSKPFIDWMSPRNYNYPNLIGLTTDNSSLTIYIYANNPCVDGQHVMVTHSDGTNAFSVQGFRVEDNTQTSFYARSLDAAGNWSECSEPMVYTEDSSLPAPF